MAENKELKYIPNRTFDIELKVGKKDLSMDLVRFTIMTSINVPYPTISLELILDTNDIILEKIYGQTPLKMIINLLATTTYSQERIELDLMYLDSDYKLGTRPQINPDAQPERSPIYITTVPVKAYQTMNYFTNKIFQGKKIEDAVKSLVQDSGAKISYDNSGKNEEVIDQILIPPNSIFNNLHYINKTFGIFNGIPAYFCSYDNTVHIKNLTNKMKSSELFTVYQLALDVDNSKIIEKSNDGKTFYTVDILSTTYKGNSVFAAVAPTVVYIAKPKDRLVHNIITDLELFTQTYGLISKNNEIFFDSSTIKKDMRIAVYKDQTGYDITETFVRANLSLNIADITELKVTLNKFFTIERLMNVGECVQINSVNSMSTDITGKYILKASDLSFTRIKEWESSCTLYLMRSNRNFT